MNFAAVWYKRQSESIRIVEGNGSSANRQALLPGQNNLTSGREGLPVNGTWSERDVAHASGLCVLRDALPIGRGYRCLLGVVTLSGGLVALLRGLGSV